MRTLLLLFLTTGWVAVEARLPDLIPYRKGNLWGYCDSTKKIVIEPKWTKVSFFDGQCASVKLGEYYGLIDKAGQYVLEPTQIWVNADLEHGLRYFSSKEVDGCGMVNDSGRVILEPEYQYLSWQGPYLRVQRQCFVGICDSLGRIIIPLKYKACGDLPECMGDSGLFAMCLRGKWGVIDTAEKIVIPFTNHWVTAWGDYWWVKDKHREVHYYDRNGKLIGDTIPRGAPFVRLTKPTLVNGLRIFKGANGLYGFEDARDRQVIEAKYLGAENFTEHDVAYVYIRKGPCKYCFVWGYVGKDGTEYWED